MAGRRRKTTCRSSNGPRSGDIYDRDAGEIARANQYWLNPPELRTKPRGQTERITPAR